MSDVWALSGTLVRSGSRNPDDRVQELTAVGAAPASRLIPVRSQLTGVCKLHKHGYRRDAAGYIR